MKPLDFVVTPDGAFGIVTEISNTQNIHSASIAFIGDSKGNKSAWWHKNEGLIVIDNLPSLLARNLVHPFGSEGREEALKIYPNED